MLLHLHFHALADQGRIPLHHPLRGILEQIKGARPLVLDTSVIIDGRIADICDTRFIDTKMMVPRFVLQELQSVADSSDKLKRNRGRRGLDMLKRMQNNTKVELQIHEGNLSELRDVHKVDERLVVLAKVLGARVVTNDFNLNKIAQLQGVEVINLNELANALKSVALPGETDGRAPGQARRPAGAGRRLPRRRHDGGGGAGTLVHRSGSDDHRHQRAANAGGADDLRPRRVPLTRHAAAPDATRGRPADWGSANSPLALSTGERGGECGREGESSMPRRFAVFASLAALALAVGLGAARAKRPTPPRQGQAQGQGRAAANASDVEKVERLMAARHEYKSALESLRSLLHRQRRHRAPAGPRMNCSSTTASPSSRSTSAWKCRRRTCRPTTISPTPTRCTGGR